MCTAVHHTHRETEPDLPFLSTPAPLPTLDGGPWVRHRARPENPGAQGASCSSSPEGPPTRRAGGATRKQQCFWRRTGA